MEIMSVIKKRAGVIRLNKEISVIIPAYNVEKYIEKCIESLLEQTYQLIEIIAIDDGSKDQTGGILDSLALKDKRLKVIHQRNGGLPVARNTGLRRANGDYIMFLDADDWLDYNCCESVITEIIDEQADLILFEHYKEYNNKTVPVSTYSKKLIYQKEGEKEFNLYDMRTITAWGKLYSKKLVSGSAFDEAMRTAEDVEFNFRVYDKVNKAVYINQQMLHYRILKKSAIHGYDSNIQSKLAYPLDTLYKWRLQDGEHENAYYSFAAVAYILVCQNGVCLNAQLTTKQKSETIKEVGNDKRYRDLMLNINSVKIPKSRKLIIWLGKVHLHFIIVNIVGIKLKLEKRG